MSDRLLLKFCSTVAGARQRTTFLLYEGASFQLNTDGARIQFDSAANALLESAGGVTLLKEKLQLAPLSRPGRPELTARMEWRYYVRREKRSKVSRRKRIVQVGRKTRV